MSNFKNAVKSTNEVYEDIFPIANEVIQKVTKEADGIIKKIGRDVENLSKNELRNYMIKLSSEVYQISDTKERASFKQEVASLLYKEKVAELFESAEGTQKARELSASKNASGEKMTEMLYEYVSDQLEAKIKRINEVIENLKSVLISRVSEDRTFGG